MKRIIVIVLCFFWFSSNLFSQQCSASNTSPPNGSPVYTLTPTLYWNVTNNVSCNPCGYNSYFVSVILYVATDPQFNNTIYTYSSSTIIYSRTVPGGYLLYNTTYWWKVRIDVIANCIYPCVKQHCFAYSSPFSFTTAITGIEKIGSEVPGEFSLSQNYPNPFNPSTKIRFALPPSPQGEGLGVRVTVYDILGREVTTLVNEQLKPGTYEVEWDATNYPSGVYYYKLKAGDFSETKKTVLMK